MTGPEIEAVEPDQEALNDVAERIWAADTYRFPEDDVLINMDGPLYVYASDSEVFS